MPAFFWIGNDLACDFANTLAADDTGPVELLGTFADVARWLVEARVIGARQGDRLARDVAARGRDGRALSAARTFRAALKALLDATTTGAAPPSAAIDAINAQLAIPLPAPLVSRRSADGAFARGEPWADLDERTLLRPIADAAATLLVDRDRSLLRRCENPRCVLYFYDTTKNHGRRWCSMDGCGNRMKAAAHYRRTRER